MPTWTDASPSPATYAEQADQTAWDDGTLWDVSGNVALTVWDEDITAWSAAANAATTWTDA